MLIRKLSFLVFIFLGVTNAQGQSKPAGYFAEIVDKSGHNMTVNSFSFAYRYSYTLANCIGACGAVADANLYFLPVNDACGAWMFPFTEIRSITDIARPSGDDRTRTATITFSDGRTSKTPIGRFGAYQNLDRVQGESALGKYSLDVEKVSAITFLHDRDVRPLPDEHFAATDAKGAMTLVCKAGAASYNLANAAFYSLRDNDTIGYPKRTLKLRVGEPTIEMAVERLKGLSLKSEANNEPQFSLTTSTGDSVEVTFIYPAPFIGGTRDGRFAYVSVNDLKQLTVNETLGDSAPPKPSGPIPRKKTK